jgi:hypothetical protein
MPQYDEMPDSWAAKYHEDRRQHGEVSAVTLSNSDKFREGHDRIAWSDAPPPSEDQVAKQLSLMLDGPPVHETRRFADNFDRIFGGKD